jgi:uncharacterized protein with PIN domain
LIDTDTYELTQIINRNNHEVSETIQDIKTLVSDIRNNHEELANKLEEENNSLADRTGYCPKCTSKIVELDKWDEPRGEMQGREVYETIYKYGCENCGYIKE